MFSIKHKDEDSTHKNQNKSEIFQNFTRTIKLLEKRTTTKKFKPSIVENYTSSIVIKDTFIQETPQFDSENAKQSKLANTRQTNAHETNNLLKKLNIYWWVFLIPLILITTGLYFEYKFFLVNRKQVTNIIFNDSRLIESRS